MFCLFAHKDCVCFSCADQLGNEDKKKSWIQNLSSTFLSLTSNMAATGTKLNHNINVTWRQHPVTSHSAHIYLFHIPEYSKISTQGTHPWDVHIAVHIFFRLGYYGLQWEWKILTRMQIRHDKMRSSGLVFFFSLWTVSVEAVSWSMVAKNVRGHVVWTRQWGVNTKTLWPPQGICAPVGRLKIHT